MVSRGCFRTVGIVWTYFGAGLSGADLVCRGRNCDNYRKCIVLHTSRHNFFLKVFHCGCLNIFFRNVSPPFLEYVEAYDHACSN